MTLEGRNARGQTVGPAVLNSMGGALRNTLIRYINPVNHLERNSVINLPSEVGVFFHFLEAQLHQKTKQSRYVRL